MTLEENRLLTGKRSSDMINHYSELKEIVFKENVLQ